uniref:Uncharacterized protein n=1 Tax=Zea mays TaxID=4577 RepID=B7ZZH3_MAIZE|nr:unknown [Zea mays]
MRTCSFLLTITEVSNSRCLPDIKPSFAASSSFTVSMTNGCLEPLLIVVVLSRRPATMFSIPYPRSFLTTKSLAMLVPNNKSNSVSVW